MRKEVGKWFMDITKYVATAVLISSIKNNSYVGNNYMYGYSSYGISFVYF